MISELARRVWWQGGLKKQAAYSIGLSAAAVIAVAALVAFGQRALPRSALAIVATPTSTPGATPTPKPDGLGPLTGLFDVVVRDPRIQGTPIVWRCIASLKQDSVNLSFEAAAQCYSQTDAGFFGAEPPCAVARPGQGICADNGGPNPPLPPPYTSRPPVKLAGSFDIVNLSISLSGCLADIASPAGPNEQGRGNKSRKSCHTALDA
jgi:hypothetical protein